MWFNLRDHKELKGLESRIYLLDPRMTERDCSENLERTLRKEDPWMYDLENKVD